jgi:hypothetical protein
MATIIKLKSDIKKLKGALTSKGLNATIKSKLKAQLEKAQNELESMKGGAKPRKVSTTKGTATTLSKLQALVAKKKYGIYKGAGVDLKKDAEEGALHVGRRVSKGLKGNQFSDKKSSKGHVYYEYRANRVDVKQPKKAQKYPKLEHGGYMGDGGEITKDNIKIGDRIESKEADYGVYVVKSLYNKNPHIWEIRNNRGERVLGEGELKFWKFSNKMAKGGMTKDELEEIEKEYLDNEDNNYHSENVVLLAKHFGNEADLKEAKRILELHEKEGHLSSENGKKRRDLHLKLIKKWDSVKEQKMADGGVYLKKK